MNSIKIKVNAKINLSLDITGIRSDGYHLLDMSMASVDVSDILSAEKSDDVSVVMNGKNASCDNTAYKALKLLHEKYGVGMRVEITKGIPFSSGMGGSSADASGVFYCASQLYGIELDQLDESAVRIGCDVPYMMRGGGARVRGVGELIQSTEFAKLTLVIAQREYGASTKEIYAEYDRLHGVFGDSQTSRSQYFNALESAAVSLRPSIARAKEDLLRHTDRVFMTGSGSAYVGLFECEEKARECAESLRGYLFKRVASTVDKGIEILETS